VIFLFLHGGPTQTETFDPKMTAPEGIRSVTGEIPTAIPGVTFGGTMTKLAGIADKIAVVRSFLTGDANHDIKPIVSKEFFAANLGSIYARAAGMNNPATGIPSNAALFPQAIDPKAQPAQAGFGNFLSTGNLGASYAPFVPGGKSDLLRNMEARLSVEKLDDRKSLLRKFDGLRHELDSSGAIEGLDRFQQQAFDVISRGVAHAFDLTKESPSTIAKYDTAPLVSIDSIPKKYNNLKFYIDNVNTLGKLLLLARRLCESGCGFVTVTTNFVWDMHADANNMPVEMGMPIVAGPFDHAVAAFVRDLEERGLTDKIMLVACGEMGRTPRVNKGGGRDHWGNISPLLIHGGGLRMGQAIGRSDSNAGEPNSHAYRNRNLVATIMNTLFDTGEVRVRSDVPGDVARLITDGEPIRELFPN
jgi:hypothetical protein